MNIKKKIKLAVIFLIVAAVIAVVFFTREYQQYMFLPKVTKNQLDKINLDKYDKLMIVAHPDDELIWGGGHLIEDDYLVVCITRGNDEKRKKEFEGVMEATDDVGMILSYPDKIAGKRSDWKGWKKDIQQDLDTIINYKDWDIVVTHNEKGEYGHQHHVMTHSLVNKACEKVKTKAKVMYFGKYYKKKNLPENGLEQINSELIQQKDEIAKIYSSQTKMISKLHHMFPYENWTEKE